MNEVTVTERDRVAHVTLNRPEQRNAVNLDMFRELVEAGQSLRERTDLTAIVLSGEGVDFCAGIDISMVQSPDQLKTMMTELLSPVDEQTGNLVQSFTTTWRHARVPVIAQLNGNVFGAGFQLAMAADIRVAAPDTRMSIMEGRWGIIPDMGITNTTGRIREDVLREMTYTARIVDAAQAAQWGLLTHVVDDPADHVNGLLQELAGRSGHAVQSAKHLFNTAPSLAGADALKLEQTLQEAILQRMFSGQA